MTHLDLKRDPELRARVFRENQAAIEKALDVCFQHVTFQTIDLADGTQWTRRDPNVRPSRKTILEAALTADISAAPVLAYFGYRISNPSPVSCYVRWFSQANRADPDKFNAAWYFSLKKGRA